MTHSHKPKVLDWKLNEEANFVASLFGCLDCDETFIDLPVEEEEVGHQHIDYVDGCFACKIGTLQLNAGDARGDVNNSGTTQKKWDSELNAYRDARSQGIQPNGTSRKQIEQAHDASDKLGSAYDGGSMVNAKILDKQTATVMRELNEAGIK